jgi:PhnB protein
LHEVADWDQLGRVQICPSFNFNGQCEAAFKLYEQSLGAKIVTLITYAGTPMAEQVPPEWRNKILHATLMLDDQALMGSDAPPGRYEAPKGSSVVLGLKDPAEAERIFNALAEGGIVTMPLAKTFWALRFGMLVDRFGISWMINCGEFQPH